MARQGTLQETFYLTEEVKQALETMMTLPEYKKDNKSEAMRKLITKEVDPETISILPEGTFLARLHRLVAYYQKREGEGLPVNFEYVIKHAVEEKDREAVAGSTNQTRLTELHTEFFRLKERIDLVLAWIEKEKAKEEWIDDLSAPGS